MRFVLAIMYLKQFCNARKFGLPMKEPLHKIKGFFGSNEKNMCSAIGYFYFNQSMSKSNIKTYNNTKEAYKDMIECTDSATKSINMLGITRVGVEVDIKNEIIYAKICLDRPGILIGLKGSNIEALEAYLTKEFKMSVKIKIIEEKDIPCLYGFQAALRGFDD